MRNIIIKKKCLLFKHEKNNQTLSIDWPTYCHTGICPFLDLVYMRCSKYGSKWLLRVLVSTTLFGRNPRRRLAIAREENCIMRCGLSCGNPTWGH